MGVGLSMRNTLRLDMERASMSRSGSSLSLSDSQDPHITAEDDFKTLIVEIAENLDNHDVAKVRYCYKRILGGRRHKLNALSILEKLEEKGILSFKCAPPLEDLLRKIHRHDLLRLVQSYASTHPSVVTNSGSGKYGILKFVCMYNIVITHPTPLFKHCSVDKTLYQYVHPKFTCVFLYM